MRDTRVRTLVSVSDSRSVAISLERWEASLPSRASSAPDRPSRSHFHWLTRRLSQQKPRYRREARGERRAELPEDSTSSLFELVEPSRVFLDRIPTKVELLERQHRKRVGHRLETVRAHVDVRERSTVRDRGREIGDTVAPHVQLEQLIEASDRRRQRRELVRLEIELAQTLK